MEYIAHRSYKYIKKVRTKSGKWRYIYSRPHGRKTVLSSGQAEAYRRGNSIENQHQQDLAFWQQQALNQAARDQAAKKEKYIKDKMNKVTDKALANMRSSGILGLIAAPFIEKWAKRKISSLHVKPKQTNVTTWDNANIQSWDNVANASNKKKKK